MTNKSKHTQEPWYFVEYAGYFDIQSGPNYGDKAILNIEADRNAGYNAKRIVDCVNACAGIENPVGLMEIYNGNLKSLEKSIELLSSLWHNTDTHKTNPELLEEVKQFLLKHS